MAPPLLQLSGISLTFGGKNLIESADLVVGPDDRICLVGRNGSGKSTLLKIAAGQIEVDSGARFVQPGATIRYLPQEPDLSGHANVGDYVRSGLGPTDDPYRALYLLEELGVSPEAAPQTLSGGEARRAAIVHALAPDPDILLLDEPTNHLDLATIEWLEAELSSRRCALVVISHDRRFLATLTRATVWIDRGLTRRIEKGFASFEAWRDTTLAEEEAAQHKLGRKIADEEHWLRYGVSARRKRNVRRLEQLHSLRREKREHVRAQGSVSLEVSEAEKSGTLVFEAKKIAKSFGEKRIVRDFSLRLLRGDRLGIIGPNGAGKTTLLKLITGALEPDSGTVRRGSNLEIASLDQGRTPLLPTMTVQDALTGGGTDQILVNGKPRHIVGYLKDFLFRPEQARAPISALSGGEKGRLMLARALALPANVLVLDEPTNDLDLETLDVLEGLLADFEGTLILISHDRDFLDRVVSTVLFPEGDGRWTEYAGGYSDMLVQRGQSVGRNMRSTAKASTSASTPAAEDKPAEERQIKRKLSFQERHQLETLPKTMEKLRAVIEKLNAKLAEPDLYQKDAKAFADATALMTKAQTELDAQEERWLELEILREELEG